MRRIIVLLVAAIVANISGLQLSAQDTKLEVYTKINIPYKKPVPYPAIREADIMWSKIIWRMVDLREKMNLPLYYPTKPIGERMNLVTLLLYGIDNEGLTVYNPNSQFDEFLVPMTKADVDVNMDAVEKKTQVSDQGGNMRDTTYKQDRRVDEVKKLMIKEKWYFDKQHSTMQVRILGLCPIRVYPRQLQGAAAAAVDEEAEMLMKQVFWVYYPEARNLLSSHPIFNRNNDAQQVSFDDLFMQRRFSSYIYQESNVYNNRTIQEYTAGVEQLLEAERIKDYLFQIEHDLWEY